MGRRHYIAILFLGYSAARGRAFTCRPIVGVVSRHQRCGHVISQSRSRPAEETAVAFIESRSRRVALAASTAPDDRCLYRTSLVESGEDDVSAGSELLKFTMPMIVVGALATAALCFPNSAVASSNLGEFHDKEIARRESSEGHRMLMVFKCGRLRWIL